MYVTSARLSSAVLASALLLASAIPTFAAGNPVQVNVTNTAPIPVVTTAPAYTPVSGFGQCAPSVDPIVVVCPLYTVPAGKRLFVDSVSWLLLTSPGQPSGTLVFGVDPPYIPFPFDFPPSANTVFIQHSPTYSIPSYTLSEGTQQINLVLEAGQIFSGEVISFFSAENVHQTFSFQGHLVDAP